jgi:hypothetical protein
VLKDLLQIFNSKSSFKRIPCSCLTFPASSARLFFPPLGFGIGTEIYSMQYIDEASVRNRLSKRLHHWYHGFDCRWWLIALRKRVSQRSTERRGFSPGSLVCRECWQGGLVLAPNWPFHRSVAVLFDQTWVTRWLPEAPLKTLRLNEVELRS